MRDEPKFEPEEGTCEVLGCTNLAKSRALWPRVSKLVCLACRKAITDKSWREVAELFGGAPLDELRTDI
jgi:hypothetical protein